jgi:hypothetical protein
LLSIPAYPLVVGEDRPLSPDLLALVALEPGASSASNA